MRNRPIHANGIEAHSEHKNPENLTAECMAHRLADGYRVTPYGLRHRSFAHKKSCQWKSDYKRDAADSCKSDAPTVIGNQSLCKRRQKHRAASAASKHNGKGHSATLGK